MFSFADTGRQPVSPLDLDIDQIWDGSISSQVVKRRMLYGYRGERRRKEDKIGQI